MPRVRAHSASNWFRNRSAGQHPCISTWCWAYLSPEVKATIERLSRANPARQCGSCPPGAGLPDDRRCVLRELNLSDDLMAYLLPRAIICGAQLGAKRLAC